MQQFDVSHPGEIIARELIEMGISARQFTNETGIQPEFLEGKKARWLLTLSWPFGSQQLQVRRERDAWENSASSAGINRYKLMCTLESLWEDLRPEAGETG